MFIIAAGTDRLCLPEDMRRLAAEVRGPVVYVEIDDGNHVAHNRPYQHRPQSADWMAKQLGATRR
jgi:2,6-dihydroxypseudooxynicotine hydrolase